MDKKSYKLGETKFINGELDKYNEYFVKLNKSKTQCKRTEAQKYWNISAEPCWI